MEAHEVVGLADARAVEHLVHNVRWGTLQSINDWHTAIGTSWDLADGKLSVVLPDGTAISRLTIENFYNDNIQDAKRLVAEDPGTMYLDVLGNTSSDNETAALRQAVARGYWTGLDQESVELLMLDYMTAGGMFMVSDADPAISDYPVHTRLDPTGCYPTFGRRPNELTDFLYEVSVNSRTLADTYSVEAQAEAARNGIQRGVYMANPRLGENVTEYTYWTKKWVYKVASHRKSKTDTGPITFLEKAENKCGHVPVAFAVERAARGNICIPFIQMLDVMKFNNTVMGMLQHHLEKGVYSPLFVRGEVDTSEYGAEGEVRGIGPDAEAKPMEPARLAPELFSVVRSNEQAARGGGAYPAQRQGQNLPSIGSGAMIAAISGERASLIRYFQRRLGAFLRLEKENDWRIDLYYLDEKKPLRAPTKERKTYTPSEVWSKEYEYHFRHVFGSEGLPSLDRRVAIQGDVGLGLMSKSTARRLNPNIPDPEDEERKIVGEELSRVFFQATMAQLPPPAMQELVRMVLEEGMEPLAAFTKVSAQSMQQPAPGAPGQPPGPAPTPQTPADAALAMQKGANPGGIQFPGLAPEAQKPDLRNVLVNIRAGGGR